MTNFSGNACQFSVFCDAETYYWVRELQMSIEDGALVHSILSIISIL